MNARRRRIQRARKRARKALRAIRTYFARSVRFVADGVEVGHVDVVARWDLLQRSGG